MTMWSLVLVSGTAFFGSGFALAQRAAEFNRTANLARFHAEVHDERAFQIGQYPEVTLTLVAVTRPRPAARQTCWTIWTRRRERFSN